MKEELTQSSIEPLINYFNNLIPLSDEEIALVASGFKPGFDKEIKPNMENLYKKPGY